MIRLTAYKNLLLQWQAGMNLIGPSTAPQIWQRHIADSLQLLPLLPPGSGPIVDLGSGAGFPGLVLAIATNRPVHLIEARAKKGAFLAEAIRATGANAHVHPIRIEAAAHVAPDAHVLTARALARLDRLLSLAEGWLRKGAIGLFHKGQEVDREIAEASRSWRFDAIKHPSLTDPRSAILEIRSTVHA